MHHVSLLFVLCAFRTYLIDASCIISQVLRMHIHYPGIAVRLCGRRPWSRGRPQVYRASGASVDAEGRVSGALPISPAVATEQKCLWGRPTATTTAPGASSHEGMSIERAPCERYRRPARGSAPTLPRSRDVHRTSAVRKISASCSWISAQRIGVPASEHGGDRESEARSPLAALLVVPEAQHGPGPMPGRTALLWRRPDELARQLRLLRRVPPASCPRLASFRTHADAR